MPRDLTPAQVALLLSIDEATWPRGVSGRGLIVPTSADRSRLAREGLIVCRRKTGHGFRWATTSAGKLRAERERAEQAERRATAP